MGVRLTVDDHADQYRPLAGYLALMGAFNALAGAGLLAAHQAGRLPERVAVRDLALTGVAT